MRFVHGRLVLRLPFRFSTSVCWFGFRYEIIMDFVSIFAVKHVGSILWIICLSPLWATEWEPVVSEQLIVSVYVYVNFVLLYSYPCAEVRHCHASLSKVSYSLVLLTWLLLTRRFVSYAVTFPHGSYSINFELWEWLPCNFCKLLNLLCCILMANFYMLCIVKFKDSN